MAITPIRLSPINSLPFKGRWRLLKNHEIAYSGNLDGERVTYTGHLVAVKPETLVVVLTQEQENQRISRRLIRLRGQWQVDDTNQLRFRVDKSMGDNSTLTFEGEWSLNNQFEIIYRYKTRALKKKKALERTLIFKGGWVAFENHRIIYRLERSDTLLEFKAALKNDPVPAEANQLSYELGVLTEHRKRAQSITFYGDWTLTKNLTVNFSLRNKKAQPSTVTFGAVYSFTKDKELRATLLSTKGQQLGVEVVFSQKILKKQGEIFVRFKKDAEESLIETGMEFKW